MTEELDCTKRRCAICDRADLPAYSFVRDLSACCYECLSALAARELSRLTQTQTGTK